MQITELGYRSVLPQDAACSCPDGADGTLLLLAAAPMDLTLNGRTLTAASGDAVIIAEHTPFSFAPAEQTLFYDWVLFRQGGERSFYRSLQLPENKLLRFAATAFLSALLEQLPEAKRAALLGVLARDPRPRYQRDAERVYTMRFADREIRFTVEDGTLRVTGIE